MAPRSDATTRVATAARQAHGTHAAKQAERRGPIRILCLKLDHIGDLLIAAQALMLLRKSFADAHITLLCAPWNVGLAQRLGIADEIHAVSFFAQNSLEDEDRAIAEARRAALVVLLQGLRLASFDIAIDLRRDEDTRELLKLFDARIRAGFGDLAAFSYLDIALPFTRHGPADGVTKLRLGPADLDSAASHRISSAGLHLTRQMAEVDLAIETDVLWSPAEDGKPDNRLLGVALARIDVRGPAANGRVSPVPRDAMIFGAGWLDWEPWGRWSNASTANLTFRFPVDGDVAQIEVRAQGHTSESHPAARVRVRGGDGTAEHRFTNGEEAATISLTCRPRIMLPTAASEPFLMRGGRYGGTLWLHVAPEASWRPLKLTIRGARLGHVLARLEMPEKLEAFGDLAFPFEVEIKDSAEPILLQLEAQAPDRGDGIAIRRLELDWLQGGYPEMPMVHMESQLMDLAAMVALRFADGLARPTREIATRLIQPRPGSTAAATVRQLRRRKRRGWPFRAAGKIIGIGIGANKETKLWPLAHFAELCRRLLGREEVTLAFIGGPQEAEAIATLMRELNANDRLIDLCACCKIEDLGEVLGQLDGYIGLDTGTTHFAGRVGLPTVAIFGAAHDPREWGPVGPTSGWATAEIACASCFKSTALHCPIDVACMSGLTPDAVWPMVETLLFDNGSRACERAEA